MNTFETIMENGAFASVNMEYRLKRKDALKKAKVDLLQLHTNKTSKKSLLSNRLSLSYDIAVNNVM